MHIHRHTHPYTHTFLKGTNTFLCLWKFWGSQCHFQGEWRTNKSRPEGLSHANYVTIWQVSLISETFMEPEMLFHLSTLSMLFMNICSKWLFYLEQNCGGPWNLYHPSPAVKQFIPGVTVWIWNAPPPSRLHPQHLVPSGCFQEVGGFGRS